MEVIMKAGFEITEEIKKIATGYDFYTCYIDNYTQMKQAEEKNNNIMEQLRLLGVEQIKQD